MIEFDCVYINNLQKVKKLKGPLIACACFCVNSPLISFYILTAKLVQQFIQISEIYLTTNKLFWFVILQPENEYIVHSFMLIILKVNL